MKTQNKTKKSNPIPPDDIRLIHRACVVAANKFNRRYYSFVRRYQAEVDDLINEALVVCLDRYWHFDEKKGTLFTFMSYAAWGAMMDWYRRCAGRYVKKGQRVYFEHPLSLDAPGAQGLPVVQNCVQEEVERRDIEENCLRIVNALPERKRNLILLRYWENTPVDEIGKHLGITQGRVSQIHSQIFDEFKRKKCFDAIWAEAY